MRKLRLYIETSVWNFYFADDAPEKKEITKEFFEQVLKGMYDVYMSRVVLDEIDRCPEPKRSNLFKLIEKCQPIGLDVGDEAEELAVKYMQKGLVPERKEEDALHIAVATVAEMDAVITWNYRHMIGLRRSELFHSTNLEEGYTKRIEITTPMGVGFDESG